MKYIALNKHCAMQGLKPNGSTTLKHGLDRGGILFCSLSWAEDHHPSRAKASQRFTACGNSRSRSRNLTEIHENPRSEGNDAIASCLMVDTQLNAFKNFQGAWDFERFVPLDSRLWMTAWGLHNNVAICERCSVCGMEWSHSSDMTQCTVASHYIYISSNCI